MKTPLGLTLNPQHPVGWAAGNLRSDTENEMTQGRTQVEKILPCTVRGGDASIEGAVSKTLLLYGLYLHVQGVACTDAAFEMF